MGRREWLALGAVCGIAVTMFMSITGVLSGLPAIASDLGGSQRDLQWVADCYPLALASLLLPAGVLADRFGRRRLLLTGVTTLMAGLVTAASAGSPSTLIIGLTLAGIGSGLGFPSTLATVTGVMPPERRSLGVSLWAASVPVGGLSGAMATGAILEFTTWPAIFVILAALAGCLMLLALWAVPETRDPDADRLDVLGALLSAGAVASLVLGLTEGPVSGWTDMRTLALFAGSFVLGDLFVIWELRTPQPLLDVRLFHIRPFACSVVAMTVMFGGLYGLVYLGYQWESDVLGWGALHSGLGLAPLAVFMLPGALFGNRIADRIGLKPVMLLALLSGAVGCGTAILSGPTHSWWPLAIGLVVFGACIGLSAGPGTLAISGPLPPSQQGVASAVNDLSRELGATLGIAVTGTAFNTAYRAYVRGHLQLPRDPVATAVLSSPTAGHRAIASAHADPRYTAVMHLASGSGWAYALVVAAAAFVVALGTFAIWHPGDARSVLGESVA